VQALSVTSGSDSVTLDRLATELLADVGPTIEASPAMQGQMVAAFGIAAGHGRQSDLH